MGAPTLVPERRPRCQVLLAAGTADPSTTFGQVVGAGPELTEPAIDITSLVTRVRTVKTLANPNGTFEIGLTFRAVGVLGRESLNLLLATDNVVVISFDAGLPDSALEPVMIGFISSIGTATAIAANGRVEHELVVSGQDAGKFLVGHDLPGPLVTALLWGDGEAAKRLDAGLVLSGSVGDVLQGAFDAVFTKFVRAPRAVREGVQLTIDPRLRDGTRSWTHVEDLWQRQGKFWPLFYGLADKQWNEVFADLTDLDYGDGPIPNQLTLGNGSRRRRYAIVARRLPFDPDDWANLETTTLRDAEIASTSVARSDVERVNFVFVAPNGNVRALTDQVVEAISFQTALADVESGERHGYHLLFGSTRYSDIGDDAHVDPTKLADAANGNENSALLRALRARADDLWRWYSINDQLWAGSMVVAGRPDLKIGTRIQNQTDPSASFLPIEDERRVYYVEKVIHDFSEQGASYLTHLAVTRGQPIDPAGAPQPVTPTRLGLEGNG